MTPELLGIWVGAFFTLCIFSFLYKDNPFFRFAESVFAGVSLGFYIGQAFGETIVPNVVLKLREGLASGEMTPFMDWGWWTLIIPMILGVVLYARYIPKISWVNRFALAIYVGYSAAVEMMQKLQGEVLPQTADTIVPLTQGWGSLLDWSSMIITTVGVIAVLVYFFFSAEHKGFVGGVSKVGIWFLMVSFGAAFSYTIMGRISILIGRLSFLIGDWLHLN